MMRQERSFGVAGVYVRDGTSAIRSLPQAESTQTFALPPAPPASGRGNGDHMMHLNHNSYEMSKQRYQDFLRESEQDRKSLYLGRRRDHFAALMVNLGTMMVNIGRRMQIPAEQAGRTLEQARSGAAQ